MTLIERLAKLFSVALQKHLLVAPDASIFLQNQGALTFERRINSISTDCTTRIVFYSWSILRCFKVNPVCSMFVKKKESGEENGKV